ncbi:MAG: hypothetical protein ACJ736_30285 [Streptomyces sp.]
MTHVNEVDARDGLHLVFLKKVGAANKLDWSRAVADPSHAWAARRVPKRSQPARPRTTGSKHQVLTGGQGIPLAQSRTGQP